MDHVPATVRRDDEPFRQLVAAFDGVYSKKGLDMPGALVQLATSYLAELRENGAGLAIEKLLHAGCKRIALAAILHAVKLISAFPDVQIEMFGSQAGIEQMSSKFGETAETFDLLARAALIKDGPEWPILAGLPSPTKMAEYLRLYEKAVHPVPILKAATGTRSIQDVERYALTSYVKKTTGDWHDGEVSAVLAAASGTPLDEGTHRTWRNRKFSGIYLPFEVIWQIAEIVEEENDKKLAK